MSVSTALIAEGMVARHSVRTFNKKSDGSEITFTSVLIIGDDTTAQVAINVERHALPPVGTFVKARVIVGVYRDDDQLDLDAWLVESPPKKGD